MRDDGFLLTFGIVLRRPPFCLYANGPANEE